MEGRKRTKTIITAITRPVSPIVLLIFVICIMFTHSIGIVTVIGQPNTDNGRRIRASRVRTKVLRLLRDRQLQLQLLLCIYTILCYCCYYQIFKPYKIHLFPFQDRLDNIIILHTVTLSNVYCYYFVFLSYNADNPR